MRRRASWKAPNWMLTWWIISGEGIKSGRETYAGANSNQRGQCSLVESEWALILEDLAGAIGGARVLGCCLQSHLDNICPTLG